MKDVAIYVGDAYGQYNRTSSNRGRDNAEVLLVQGIRI